MDYEARRDPDAILRQIVEEEAAEGDTRGKLKIFFAQQRLIFKQVMRPSKK